MRDETIYEVALQFKPELLLHSMTHGMQHVCHQYDSADTHPHQPADWNGCQQLHPPPAAINSAWNSCKPGLVCFRCSHVAGVEDGTGTCLRKDLPKAVG